MNFGGMRRREDSESLDGTSEGADDFPESGDYPQMGELPRQVKCRIWKAAVMEWIMTWKPPADIQTAVRKPLVLQTVKQKTAVNPIMAIHHCWLRKIVQKDSG